MLNIMVFRRPGQAVLLMVAALLTTSRTPIIALILLTTGWLLFQSVRTRVATLLAIVISVVALTLVTAILEEFGLDPNLLDRLLLFDDRDEIYSFALVLVQQSPWIGYGGVLLDESIGFFGHPSFHNSYLDIAVRHGLPALAIFLLLLVPPRGSWRHGGWRFASVVVFVLVGSMFQNFLKHPHILMLYTVLIETSILFSERRSER
jgi:O-antigen ligase